MFLVGLTGGIASGKSSVLQVFQQLGCAVIDVDVIARHGRRYVILDIPLLFETKKLLKYLKHVIVVYCNRDTQLLRLMERNGLSLEDAEARIQAQLPLKDKVWMANHVLDNSGRWSDTRRQAILLHMQLEQSLEYLPLRLGMLVGLAGIASLLYLLARCLLPSP